MFHVRLHVKKFMRTTLREQGTNLLRKVETWKTVVAVDRAAIC